MYYWEMMHITRLILSLAMFLSMTACSQHYELIQPQHPFDEGDGLWSPSSLQVQKALKATEGFCSVKMKRDSENRKLSGDIEVVIVGIDEKSTLSSEPNMTSQAEVEVNDIRYVDLRKRIGAFIEDNLGGRIRFIAIQHFPSRDVGDHSKSLYQYPFTLYYNCENGRVGMNTVQTWDRDESNPFDLPTIVYSPGPPFFLIPVNKR